MENISDRLKKALIIRNMTQSDLVRKTGIGKSSICTYLSGAYEPKQKNLYKIAKALNINEAWLMGYNIPFDKKSASEDALTKQIINSFNSLSDDKKQQAADFLRYLAESQENR